jgi:hypothetical protein
MRTKIKQIFLLTSAGLQRMLEGRASISRILKKAGQPYSARQKETSLYTLKNHTQKMPPTKRQAAATMKKLQRTIYGLLKYIPAGRVRC